MTGGRRSSAVIGRTRWLLLVTALVAGCASAPPSATLTSTLQPTATPIPTPSPTPVPIPTPIPLDEAMLARRFETDIRLDELPTLLEIGRRSASATVTMIVLRPPRYSRFVGIEPNSNRGWVMIPNVAEMRRYTKSTLFD